MRHLHAEELERAEFVARRANQRQRFAHLRLLQAPAKVAGLVRKQTKEEEENPKIPHAEYFGEGRGGVHIR